LEHEESDESKSRQRSGTTVFAKTTTDFGRAIGIEVEDIANFLTKVGDKSKLWAKFVGADKKSISKERELYKIAYGLTFATLRRKHSNAKKPPQDPIKELVSKLKLKLQINKFGTNFELTQEKFINSFDTILNEISDDMKNKK